MSDSKNGSPEKGIEEQIIDQINKDFGGARRYSAKYTAAADQTAKSSDIPEAKQPKYSSSFTSNNVTYTIEGKSKDQISEITVSSLTEKPKKYKIEPTFKVETKTDDGILTDKSQSLIKKFAAAEHSRTKGTVEVSSEIPYIGRLLPSTQYKVIEVNNEPAAKPKASTIKIAANQIPLKDSAILVAIAGKDGTNAALPNVASSEPHRTT